MKLEDLIGLLIPVTFIVALVVERLFRAQELPRVRFWLAKGIGFFILTCVVNAAVPLVVGSIVGDRAPLHLESVGVVSGALLAFLVADIVGYWVHRFMHRLPFVWRWTHQMHHSAERMDLAGLAYAHPIDMLLTFVPPALAAGLLGLSADAIALAGYMGFVAAIIQHINVRTPRWLGYFLQRPEMHGVHHTRGVHAYNYGAVTLWDMLFGTFRNPETFPAEYGFWPGASKRVGAMLVGRDVGEPAKSA